MKVTRSVVQESLYFHSEDRLRGSCLVSVCGNEARISNLHGEKIYMALVKEIPFIFERHKLKYIRFVIEKWHVEKLRRIKLDGYKIEIDIAAFGFDGTKLFWAAFSKS